jgi:uncharacterized membrane protein YwaF
MGGWRKRARRVRRAAEAGGRTTWGTTRWEDLYMWRINTIFSDDMTIVKTNKIISAFSFFILHSSSFLAEVYSRRDVTEKVRKNTIVIVR